VISFFEFHGSKIQQYTEGDDGDADDTEGDDNRRLMTAMPITAERMTQPRFDEGESSLDLQKKGKT